MSLLSQLNAFIAEGKIAKAGKPRKGKVKKPVDPNIAKRYQRPGTRLPGERFGFQSIEPPVPKPVIYEEIRVIYKNIFIMPVLIPYIPDELEKATYSPFDFIGCSPIWKQHLYLHNEE